MGKKNVITTECMAAEPLFSVCMAKPVAADRAWAGHIHHCAQHTAQHTGDRPHCNNKKASFRGDMEIDRDTSLSSHGCPGPGSSCGY